MIHRFSGKSEIIPTQRMGRRSDAEQLQPLLQTHDAESVDHSLAGSLADEIINISGASVVVYARTNSDSFDEVYEEDANPTYKAGKRLKAYFVPQPIAAQLTVWGIDAPNQTTVVFSRDQVYKEFNGRMIRVGDIIELPYNASGIKPDRYRVLNAFDSGNFKYNWLYWSCVCENITDDSLEDIDHK